MIEEIYATSPLSVYDYGRRLRITMGCFQSSTVIVRRFPSFAGVPEQLRHQKQKPIGLQQDAQNGLAQSLRLRREDLDDPISGAFSRRSLNDSAVSGFALFVAKKSPIVQPDGVSVARFHPYILLVLTMPQDATLKVGPLVIRFGPTHKSPVTACAGRQACGSRNADSPSRNSRKISRIMLDDGRQIHKPPKS